MSDEESIDHFRPRERFPSLQFDWANLVYACYRCNQQKGGKWPVIDDLTNMLLAATYRPKYTSVWEYVNPSKEQGRRPAQEFFDWDFDSGEMSPSLELNQTEWSIARRTIDDIDLNYERSDLDPYHPDHVLNQRRYHLYLFLEQVQASGDLALVAQIAQGEFAWDQPYFEFISAFLKTSR